MSDLGIINVLSKFSKSVKNLYYAKVLNGSVPVFTQFGEDIYASDIVQNCIRCIATEMSKLQPKHIRTDNATGIQSVVSSSINRLLKFGPNEWMTTTDFLENITYLREINKNAFIYPAYREVPLSDGLVRREYTGFYPLNPREVEFLQDASGTIYIRMHFANFYEYTMPYADIIHWRKDFGANEFMGGDANGRANNDAILKQLKINDIVYQGLEKGIKAGLTIRGLLKINTMLADEKQEQDRIAFEQKMANSESGILAIDLKSDYQPLTLDPKIIDKETMEFLDKRIINNFDVSLPILNGTFTEEEYQAFYEKKLEPMVISLGRAFSKTLFTARELDVGNEVIFYSQGLLFTNMANKISAVDVLSSRGTLTDNQILAIFGYPPFEGGDIRHMSLNYINREIADSYQMGKLAKEKEVKYG
ncbi:MAG: portal protein [Sedimentibacter sp.]|nr:portal protein [Sedimentibacter sp.]